MQFPEVNTLICYYNDNLKKQEAGPPPDHRFNYLMNLSKRKKKRYSNICYVKYNLIEDVIFNADFRLVLITIQHFTPALKYVATTYFKSALHSILFCLY